MSDFRLVPGFEDVWRNMAPPNRRRPEALLGKSGTVVAPADRLARMATGAREVVVAVTSSAPGQGGLQRQLDYIARRGELALEDQDGFRIAGRAALKDLAEDWAAMASADSHRVKTAPVSRSMVLAMPPGTDPGAVAEASRAAARQQLGDRFDFVWICHTDTSHPHVHMVVRTQGTAGERFSPDRTDLHMFREAFAGALRDRGVLAEATPRRLRGITRKAEAPGLRKMREQYERGEGPMPWTLKAAYLEATGAAFDQAGPLRPWEAQIAQRQRQVHALYRNQAQSLLAAKDPEHRRLGGQLEAFVAAMPAPDTRRLALARQLRTLNQALLERSGPRRDRTR